MKTEYNFLSLGAGVQSTCMALMFAKKVIAPMPNAAIFADTKAEPQSIYEHIKWLEKELPFPLYVVSAGSLTERITQPYKTKQGRFTARIAIPAFVDVDGKGSLTGRDCTTEYKIKPVLKKHKELANIKRGQTQVTVTNCLGISVDEIQRMKKAREKWSINRWPLIEERMTRHDCKLWLARNGYPEPPRSACVYCPFHSDNEWDRIKREDPASFAEAVKVEQQMQALNKASKNSGGTGYLQSTPFLHRSCKPLADIEFNKEPGQLDLFDNECEGLCGI